MPDEATTIARGGKPEWRQTFTHETHGELEFVVPRMPVAADWLQIAALGEMIAPGVSGGAGALLAEAIAGLSTLCKPRPVISEERIEDPENPGHQKLVQTLYDPLQDEYFEFPRIVWSSFLLWREEMLSPETVEKVKNSSSATTEPDIVAPSPAGTD